MLLKRPSHIKPSEITDNKLYLDRRRFLQQTAGAATTAAFLTTVPALLAPQPARAATKLSGVVKSPYTVDGDLTSLEDITQYNNFYEFGTGKEDPAKYSKDFKTRPWSIEVEGECEKPGVYDLEEFMSPYTLEERIYRLRCVEAWSMIIPWVGFPLGPVLKRFQPTSNAKYVAFQTLLDPEQMRGQRRRVLDWPYVEGLRIDEAMHPLTIFAVGLYGEVLPNQNGAPIRLVIPWKYGFKSIKSIVKIAFTEQQPPTTWNQSAPYEYGFYSNVNPERDHPRWSQKKERRVGGSLFTPKQPTLMFNGYADEVAGLYAGMDLIRDY